MVPLYAARTCYLGPGDFVLVGRGGSTPFRPFPKLFTYENARHPRQERFVLLGEIPAPIVMRLRNSSQIEGERKDDARNDKICVAR